MGALHQGHISLIKSSLNSCDITIASIFVNPTQFNNADDLSKYPRTLTEDLALLSTFNCDIVFTPSEIEMYPENYEATRIDLGNLANLMEGKYRPGHFDGVVDVVSRLFNIIKPTKAFFGLKDFQQVAVIKFMTNKLNLPVEIIACPTLRETSGLAMSSRNLRLSEPDKIDALLIFKSLNLAKRLAADFSPLYVKEHVISYFKKGNLDLEYFEIVNPLSLESLDEEWVKGATACIVAYCGNVRLIDNLQLIDY